MDDNKKDQQNQTTQAEDTANPGSLEYSTQTEEGQKGGAAVQQKQEEEQFKEYEEKGPQAEDSGNVFDDLWGEE
jgi:hypothetical protein